jgi:putative transposase
VISVIDEADKVIAQKRLPNDLTKMLAVPARHTSQTRPCCGHVSKDNRQIQAIFLCVECGYGGYGGYENHADVVGAINVLERGHRSFAYEEMTQSGRSKRQEPTEATRESSRSAVGTPFP